MSEYEKMYFQVLSGLCANPSIMNEFVIYEKAERITERAMEFLREKRELGGE